jgi:hypothetical protein
MSIILNECIVEEGHLRGSAGLATQRCMLYTSRRTRVQPSETFEASHVESVKRRPLYKPGANFGQRR